MKIVAYDNLDKPDCGKYFRIIREFENSERWKIEEFRRNPRITDSKNARHKILRNSMLQNLGIVESSRVPFSFDLFQCSADITIVVGVLSARAATPIFFHAAATVKSSEKSEEEKRRAIYDEGTNVESGEKREILNDQEWMSNGVGEGKGRSTGLEKFRKREQVGTEGERKGEGELWSRKKQWYPAPFYSTSAEASSSIRVVSTISPKIIKKRLEEIIVKQR